jgi:hypothetical protein
MGGMALDSPCGVVVAPAFEPLVVVLLARRV